MIEKNISTNENLVQDISNELIFGHTHNGVKCAVCPTAKRACDRAWFSEKQIEEWSEMSKMTLWRWLEKLEKARRIATVSDMIQIYIQDSCGVPHETTLYNLNVLNQLAMACIDNEKLNEVSCKFSDILSEVGTTGSDSIRKPYSYMIEDKIERAERWIEETEEWQEILSVVKNAYDETKALLAEERLKFEMLSEAVDDLVRTNARVNDKKGAESKESEEAYMTARDWCLKHKLPVSTNEPEETVSKQLTDICMTFPKREQWHQDSSGTKLFPQWACNILDKVYDDNYIYLLENRTE